MCGETSLMGAGTTFVGIRLYRAPHIIESLLAVLTALSLGSRDHFRWVVKLGFLQTIKREWHDFNLPFVVIE